LKLFKNFLFFITDTPANKLVCFLSKTVQTTLENFCLTFIYKTRQISVAKEKLYSLFNHFVSDEEKVLRYATAITKNLFYPSHSVKISYSGFYWENFQQSIMFVVKPTLVCLSLAFQLSDLSEMNQ
jgi:hypothetical protein